jgi:hypothetical protein
MKHVFFLLLIVTAAAYGRESSGAAVDARLRE